MSAEQKTSGIYRVVINVAFYEVLQKLFGAKGHRKRYFWERVKLGIEHDVLDDHFWGRLTWS